MSALPIAAAPLAAIALVFGLYFAVVIPSYERATRSTVLWFGLQKRQSWVAASDLVRLGIATLGQALFLAVIATGLGVEGLGLHLPTVRSLFLGALLGLGEMAAAALLVHLVLTTLSAALPGKVPANVQGWIPYSRGGWMRYYLNTLQRAPLPLKLVLTCGYVGVEELIYRSVVIDALRVHGMAIAVSVSTLLFVVGQVVCTPGWRTALFPVLGALVVGPIHAWLYFTVPDVTPLITAHVVFFFVSVL